MSRKKVDLRTLPGWLQIVIVFAVIAIVALMAWFMQGNAPTPTWIAWITDHLALLGGMYIIALTIVIALWVRRKRRNRDH